MRDWDLGAGDPLALRLAADVRLTPTDYANDHIWELQLAGADPAAFALRTSYGKRVADMRLFPIVGEAGSFPMDPAEFVLQPRVRRFYVNYLRVVYQPLPGLDVVAEFWVPDSHAVVGRLKIHNTSDRRRVVEAGIGAALRSGGDAPPMAPEMLAGQTVLVSRMRPGALNPLVMLDGATAERVAGEPALLRECELAPGETRELRWVQAALATPDASLQHARRLRALDLDAESDRIERVNASLVEIETGDPDWDAALALAQKVALQSYVGPTEHLPHPSFIFTRLPERGYSAKGDGSDHNWQWDGQVATEAYVNCPQVVLSAPDLAKGVVRNFLSVQKADGSIDWKPGLAGQRNGALCMPLLASLAWIIYEHTEDDRFLAEVFDGLRDFLQAWFSRAHDRDQDGVPEWTHTIQSAFDDWPSFSAWRPWAQGLDVRLAEVPDLTGYLYAECAALARMARRLGREEVLPELEARASGLRDACEAAWSEATACYHFVDRDHHQTTPGAPLGRGRGPYVLRIKRSFAPPGRVLVLALGGAEAPAGLKVRVFGRGPRGGKRGETLRTAQFTWHQGFGAATTQTYYHVVERVEVTGVDRSLRTEVQIADYTRQDQTQLLPLWAGIPGPERAEALVRRTILNSATYWRPYGIPNCSAQDPAYRSDNRDGSGGVWMMWNTMVGEGLAAYGYRTEAAELIQRLMQVMLHTLKTEAAFREAYDADRLQGLGDRDYLWGVAPVHLFLRVLGVRVLSPRRVFVEAGNPFPWPVTVRHHGVSVIKDGHRTYVIFPAGDRFEFADERPHVVELPAQPAG